MTPNTEIPFAARRIVIRVSPEIKARLKAPDDVASFYYSWMGNHWEVRIIVGAGPKQWHREHRDTPKWVGKLIDKGLPYTVEGDEIKQSVSLKPTAPEELAVLKDHIEPGTTWACISRITCLMTSKTRYEVRSLKRDDTDRVDEITEAELSSIIQRLGYDLSSVTVARPALEKTTR